MKHFIDIMAIFIMLLAFVPIYNTTIKLFHLPISLVWNIGITIILLILLTIKVVIERKKA